MQETETNLILDKSMVRIGIVGCGYWGPNYIRIFNELPNSCVSVCCDSDPSKLSSLEKVYPSIKKTTNYIDVLKDPLVDAVCVSTQ